MAETSIDAEGRVRWGSLAAGLLLRRADGAAFLVRRSADVLDPGVWSIPGGRVEPGESVDEAAHAEALEELGSVPAYAVVGRDTYHSGGFRYVTLICRVPEGAEIGWRPRLNWENTAWGWFRPGELPEPLHENVTRVLSRGWPARAQKG